MDDSPWTKVLALLALVGVAGFFAGSESALFSLGLYRVRRLRAVARKSYDAAQKMLADPTRLISTLLTGNELVNAAIGIVGSSLIYDLLHDMVSEPYLSVVAIGSVLPFVLIFGDIVPKIMGMKNPEAFVSKTAVPLYYFSNLVAPIRDLISATTSKVLSCFGKSARDRDAISEVVFRSMVDAGLAEGVIDDQERRYIHNVFNLDDVVISQIMTPKEKVSAMKSNIKISEAKKIVESERYSRFPVLSNEGSEVVGTLYTKDLLRLTYVEPHDTIDRLIRPPFIVSPDTNALDLFARFKRQRTHFGVVCQTGTFRMMGVVTLEDVLEEIFGDIRDEVDRDEGASSKLS